MAVVVKSESNSKETSHEAIDKSDLQYITIGSDPQPIQTHAKGNFKFLILLTFLPQYNS